MRTLKIPRMSLYLTLLAIGLQVLSSTATADVRLPHIFGDHMVLQQGRPIPVWGWAEAGEKVTVTIEGNTASVAADAEGRWMVKLPALKAGGPCELTVKGNNTITCTDVLIGEVWICSGQSNMEWPVSQTNNAEQEIANADLPQIRHFDVANTTAFTRQRDCNGAWSVCSPQTVPGYTAVGFYFGRYLHKQLNVPIGLVNTSWGGTVAEAWTRAEALSTLPDFAGTLEQIEKVAKDPEKVTREYQKQLADWNASVEKADKGSGSAGLKWAEPSLDISDWKDMELPQLWETVIGDIDGVIWFRKTFKAPESWQGKELVVELGAIDDEDVTFLNGKKIGETTGEGSYNKPRQYKVAADIVRTGDNVVAVRAYDYLLNGGFSGKSDQMKVYPVGQPEKAVSLAGAWKYKIALDLATLPPRPRPPISLENPNSPTVLYNAMIAPLVPYGIRGAIWYQGESNADRAQQYQVLFPTMIRNWRSDWGQGDFPFIFVQLANFMKVREDPSDSSWARLREAQLMTLSLPNTGMAVIIDIGQADDIHPRNKQDVGKRLALWALANIYGKTVVYSGPLFKYMDIVGNQAVIHFDHVGAGLVAKDGPLKGFAIAGKDGRFVWADARIEGDALIVSSDKVAQPAAVRYAWADNPVCNLYNKDGLPASPFRTDAP